VKKGEMARAANEFESAARLKDSLIDCYAEAARAYSRAGMNADAARCRARYLELRGVK
jgi:hypothetical protein